MPAADMPAAEAATDAAVVRRLLASQFPDLAALPVEAQANGWDCAVHRLGPDLVVRLPRRAVAAEAFAAEQRWLGSLAPSLPLAVPVSLRVGQPDGDYPFSWSVCPWIEGDTADVAGVASAPDAAAALGGFLRALHVPAPAGAPTNPWRGVPLADRVERWDQHLAAVAGVVDAAALDRRFRTAVAAPVHAGPPVWIHGDLHPGNMVVHEGRLAGVIDFVDLCGGDPTTDLAAAWMLLPGPADRAALRRAAGDVDGATWLRAEGWALVHAVATLANSADNERMAAMARATLARLAQD